MMNLYWPVYKNLEKEVLDLSNHVHFDDNQLSIYSVKISELLIRCCVEIEAISKELYFREGGLQPENEKDLYFDTDCIKLLEDKWSLSKKKLIISAPNFYFQNEDNRVLTPLHKASKRGASSSDWQKAYQGIKHNRTSNLSKGNIKNLLRALGSLFILNVYFKDDVYGLKENKETNFPINIGSDIFSIKLHLCSSAPFDDGFLSKKEDFNECIYITKVTEKSIINNQKAMKKFDQNTRQNAGIDSARNKAESAIKSANSIAHQKAIEELKQKISEVQRNLSRVAIVELKNIIGQSEFEAILNTKPHTI